MRPPDHTSSDAPFLLDRAVHYTVRDGLPHDDVQALAADGQGRLWVTTAAGTAAFIPDGDGLAPAPIAPDEQPPVSTAGEVPAIPGVSMADVRAAAADGSGHFWVATATGVRIGTPEQPEEVRWEVLDGALGLPHGDVLCLSLAPSPPADVPDAGGGGGASAPSAANPSHASSQVPHPGEGGGASAAAWFGLAIGAARLEAGRWDFFAGGRWLPENRVQAVVALPDGGAWLGTPRGLVRIRREPLTLAHKAILFEQRVRVRHCRRGFVAACRLARPGDLSGWKHVAEDNDGLWTALYAAAECFRYAATGSPGARRFARESVHALLDLERLTPVPGYPARAIAQRGEQVVRSDWERGRWHEEPDGLQWKGDTSADELDGHFFAYAAYYDLVADEAERAEVRAVVGRMVDHLLDHDLLLAEQGMAPGEHTTWGVYAPHLLNDPSSRYYADQGLFSLCILSHLKVAEHLWQESDPARAARYGVAYWRLIREHGYALNVLRQNFAPPFPQNHSDDEMAFIAYQPLLRYETDPALRAIYLLALRKDWEIERPERSPFTNLLYAAAAGTADCDLQAAVQTLREIPLDQVNWGARNGRRQDLPRSPLPDRFGAAQSAVALRPGEHGLLRWNGNPYRLDASGNGLTEGDGVLYLLPYWLGRYLGLIAPASAEQQDHDAA